MTSAIETIDGHTYFVVRDANGVIVQQEARDTIAPMVIGNQGAVVPANATLADVYTLLLEISKKLS